MDWEDEFFIAVGKLVKVSHRYLANAVGQSSFRLNEIEVLLFLYHNTTHGDTVTDIAQAYCISKAMITRAVDHLHQRGLLTSTRDMHDRRIVHLQLTSEGVAAATRLDENRRSLSEQLWEGIDAHERTHIEKVTAKIQHNLDRMLKEK